LAELGVALEAFQVGAHLRRALVAGVKLFTERLLR
jgi:hypothetical protein